MAHTSDEVWKDVEMELGKLLYPVGSCDYCGRSPVVYEDESFSLCEHYREQLLGD